VVALALATAATAATAAAEPRRPGLTGGVLGGGGAGSSAGARGPGLTLGAHLGYLFADAARFGVEAELFGGQAWIDGGHRVDGVLLGGLRLWPTDRLSFTLGLGVAAGDDSVDDSLVGAGAAAGATLGLDVRRWRRTALALRAVAYGGEFADARAIHVGLTLAIEWYGLTTPPPE